MGWIACVRCKKIRCEFVARTFALIAPVQPISRRVSCSNETIQNAPKHYKPHQFMSLASNGVDRVRSLRKTLMPFRGTNFFINCTSSTHFAPSSVYWRNIAKCTETLQNAPEHEFGSNGVDRVRSLRKILMRVRGMKFCVNCISAAVLHRVSCSNEKNPKCTQILQKKPIHDFRVQWGRSGAFVAKNSEANLWHKLVH